MGLIHGSITSGNVVRILSRENQAVTLLYIKKYAKNDLLCGFIALQIQYKIFLHKQIDKITHATYRGSMKTESDRFRTPINLYDRFDLPAVSSCHYTPMEPTV